jgi:general secretion pathway protein J
MKKTIKNKTKKGFTLIEIVLAISIFGILATATLTSFNTLAFSSRILNRDIRLTEMANRCLNRMTRDIRAAHVSIPPFYSPPRGHEEQDPDPYRVEGDEGDEGFPRLRFASLAHLPIDGNPASGIARIVYYVDEGRNGGRVLKRSDDLEPFEPFEKSPHDPVLCENVRSVQFRYHYQNDAQKGWNSDSPEDQYGSPQAISIRLELGDDRKKVHMSACAAFSVFRKKRGSRP